MTQETWDARAGQSDSLQPDHRGVGKRPSSPVIHARLFAAVDEQIRCSTGYLLLPALSDFYAANPDVLLQLICIDESSSFDILDFDIEVRFVSGNWNDGINYPLLEEVILPVARPGFLRQHSIKKTEDLCFALFRFCG